MTDDDDDALDGCDLDFSENPDNDEMTFLRALFPGGEKDAHLEAEWRELFDGHT